MNSLNNGLNVSDVLRNMPSFTFTKTMELIESIVKEIEYDKIKSDLGEEGEPERPTNDQWRRQNAHLMKEFIRKPDNKIEELEEEQFEEKPPSWEEFQPEIVQTQQEPESDLYDDHLRSQLSYREKMRKEFEENQAQIEKEKQEERRKIRVLVDGQPEKVTYDIDGKIILKAKRVQLAPVKKIEGQQVKESAPSQTEELAVIKPRRPALPKPKLKLFKVQPSNENAEALKIIAQQERNHLQEFMDVLELKPGVFLEIDHHEKGQRNKHTQAQDLPYRVQNKMDQYLASEQSQSIRLSKEEYSSITINNSILRGSYEQSYLKKKSGIRQNTTQKTKQSDYEDTMPKNGIVKVNDIGKFYDLLIKDSEIIEENTHTEFPPILMDKYDSLSIQEFKTPIKSELPSIPATQFYKYLSKQQPPSLSRIDNNSVTGSVTSKLTRDRSMPEVISNMKLHQCLAAPKIGKYLGFGINQKYKF
ncbi:unnamed protein product (macronuclear) [Paramecium tetraurelia]|uniref:Uncharacterized protein n=1 Tax=Paramecium tetraurelia TaxID=5888 RepID=A0BHD4_PARTE|nr:uncharacterized protein GSPATT00028986001 [Paramecium tetraurelia]CAK57951.1 unnamed protein product [Paramecium tetraurelia]|eukprot:XP_001425349.1 hypothetical protein (macronuclear) [Paramecium tetraurelia strain d4-2]